MNDNVDRLRAVLCDDKSVELLAREAADEIVELRAERDEARRIACTYIIGTYSKNNVMINRVSAMAEAARRGWDCYKENKR